MHPINCSTRDLSAAGVLAESGKIVAAIPCAVMPGVGSAASSTTCALAPPKPNELTPARRGRLPPWLPDCIGHARPSRSTSNGLPARSI